VVHISPEWIERLYIVFVIGVGYVNMGIVENMWCSQESIQSRGHSEIQGDGMPGLVDICVFYS
jgi:hypothetical protein